MATLTIRNVDPELREALRVRAARHGRSMEAELREILKVALGGAARSSDTRRCRSRSRAVSSDDRPRPERFVRIDAVASRHTGFRLGRDAAADRAVYDEHRHAARSAPRVKPAR